MTGGSVGFGGLRIPMKEESWVCEAHRNYFVMHSDCWLSSLLRCCFYSEPQLPVVWMVIVVSFHSDFLCSIMWSVANHRCACCILIGWICDSEMTAAILGFRRVDLQGSSVFFLLNPCCPIAPLCFLYHGLLYIHVWPSGEPLRPERLHHCGCLYDFSHGCRVGKCREVSI